MKYLFGPVNSRRLGVSLGVDLLPFKTCSLNCVYCECGKTTNITALPDEYVPTDAVIEELRAYLSAKPRLDIISFSGCGEPTLHSGIGDIIKFLKSEFQEYRIAVITNSTLLRIDKVRRAILGADIIIPSLDAASEDVFNKIARPAQGITAAGVVEGLNLLRLEYKGSIYLEIFIVPGVNDARDEIVKIREVCSLINPDRIQLNSLDRPGAEEWVKRSQREKLLWIKEFFNSFKVDVIGNPEDHHINKVSGNAAEITEAVISTVRRRPCTLDDLSIALGIGKVELHNILDGLIREDLIEIKTQSRGEFYILKQDT